MTDQSQKTKKSTDEQSISTSRRSVLSTVGAGVAALGVGVGSTGSVKAASGTALPMDPSDWRTGGYQNANKTDDLGYDLRLRYFPNRPRPMEFSTTATKTGKVNLKWRHNATHGMYREMEITISVNGDTKVQESRRIRGRSNSDYTEGRVTLSLNRGDTVTIKTSGGQDGGKYYQYYGSVALAAESVESAPTSAITDHDADIWEASDDGSVSSGSNAVEFAYKTYENWATQEYETTATSSKTLEVDWSYTGNHSTYYSGAYGYILVNGKRKKVLLEENTDGDFSFTGRTQISVSEGDTVTLKLYATNYTGEPSRGKFIATFSEV